MGFGPRALFRAGASGAHSLVFMGEDDLEN